MLFINPYYYINFKPEQSLLKHRIQNYVFVTFFWKFSKKYIVLFFERLITTLINNGDMAIMAIY